MDFVKLRMLGRGLLGFLSLLRLILPNPSPDTQVTPVTPVTPDTQVTEPSTQPDPTSGNADVSCEVVCSTNGPNVFTFKSAIPLLLYDFQSLSRQLAAVFPHYCYHRFQSLVVAYPANTLINVLNRMTVVRNSFTAHLAIKLSALPGNRLIGSRDRRIIAKAIIKRISRPVPRLSTKVCDFPEHEDDTFKVVFSPSGAICAITSWGTVKICKVENGRFVCLHALKHRARAMDVKFHPTLPYIVVCADTATIYRIMDDGTFKVVATIEAKRFESATVCIPQGDFFSASFHPTDRLIALGCDNWCIYLYIFTDEGCTKVQRFDRTGECWMNGHFNTVDTILFHPSGNLFVSGSDDRTVKVWEKEENGLWVCARTIEDYDDYVRAVAFDSTGQFLVTTSCDNTIRVYETGTWECLQTIHTDNTKGISSCMFYPSNQVSIFATGSYDGKTTFFRLSDDGTTSEVLETLTHPSGVYSLSFDQITRSLVVGLCMNYENRHKSTVELYQLPK